MLFNAVKPAAANDNFLKVGFSKENVVLNYGRFSKYKLFVALFFE